MKAVVKYDDGFLPANICFEKNGRTFTLHTESFGDTCYSKGFWGYVDKNANILKHYRGKTLKADYHEYNEEGYNQPIYTPFFFRDLDFDGHDELVIVHYTMAVKYHDEFDVYRIVDGQPILLDYPPFRGEDDGIHNYRMTDYTEFDKKTKTATSVYPEGEMMYDGRIVYGVAKNKEQKVINGKPHTFNHLTPIREHRYLRTEGYGDFGELVYKFVGGRKVIMSHDFNLDSIFIKSRCWTCRNDRFGFEIEYPSFMDMVEAENNDGATFTFQDVAFKAWGS